MKCKLCPALIVSNVIEESECAQSGLLPDLELSKEKSVCALEGELPKTGSCQRHHKAIVKQMMRWRKATCIITDGSGDTLQRS